MATRPRNQKSPSHKHKTVRKNKHNPGGRTAVTQADVPVEGLDWDQYGRTFRKWQKDAIGSLVPLCEALRQDRAEALEMLPQLDERGRKIWEEARFVGLSEACEVVAATILDQLKVATPENGLILLALSPCLHEILDKF